MICLLAVAPLLLQPAPPAPTATLKVDGVERVVDQKRAGTHEYQTVEVWLGTNAAVPNSGLVVEAPIRNGRYQANSLISESAGNLHYMKLVDGMDVLDANTWDSNTKQYMMRTEGAKHGTGRIEVFFAVVGSDKDGSVETLVSGKFSGTLRYVGKNKEIESMKIEGEFHNLPFNVPLKEWEAPGRQGYKRQ